MRVPYNKEMRHCYIRVEAGRRLEIELDSLFRESFTFSYKRLAIAEAGLGIMLEHLPEIIAGLSLLYTWYRNRKHKKPKVVIERPDGTIIQVHDERQIKKLIDDEMKMRTRSIRKYSRK